jgi:antitoxin YefM
MINVKITEDKSIICQLVDRIHSESQPAFLIGKDKNAVLISEKDWLSIQETLYLSLIPKMIESIVEGGKEPLENCVKSEDVLWD